MSDSRRHTTAPVSTRDHIKDVTSGGLTLKLLTGPASQPANQETQAMREIPGLRSELTVTFTINHSAPIGSAQEIAEAAAALLESYWLPVGSEISAEVQFAFITRPGYIAGLIGRPELAGFDSPAGAGDSVEADRG